MVWLCCALRCELVAVCFALVMFCFDCAVRCALRFALWFRFGCYLPVLWLYFVGCVLCWLCFALVVICVALCSLCFGLVELCFVVWFACALVVLWLCFVLCLCVVGFCFVLFFGCLVVNWLRWL